MNAIGSRASIDGGFSLRVLYSPSQSLSLDLNTQSISQSVGQSVAVAAAVAVRYPNHRTRQGSLSLFLVRAHSLKHLDFRRREITATRVCVYISCHTEHRAAAAQPTKQYHSGAHNPFTCNAAFPTCLASSKLTYVSFICPTF